MGKARTVVHQLLEDGPEEAPRDYILQYGQERKPEVFMQYLARDFAHFTQKLEDIGVLSMLRKKYDDDVVAEAVMMLVLERSSLAQGKRAYAELKRLARFYV